MSEHTTDFMPAGGSTESRKAARIPPQNLEAEQSVLGSILLKDKAFGTVLEILKASDFYRSSHQLIYEALLDLFDKNEPQDLLTVTNLLKDRNQLEPSAVRPISPALLPLSRSPPISPHMPGSSGQKSILRNLIQVNTEIATAVMKNRGISTSWSMMPSRPYSRLPAPKAVRTFTPLKQIIPGAFQTIEQL